AAAAVASKGSPAQSWPVPRTSASVSPASRSMAISPRRAIRRPIADRSRWRRISSSSSEAWRRRTDSIRASRRASSPGSATVSSLPRDAFGHVQLVLGSRDALVAHVVHQRLDDAQAEAAGLAVADQALEILLRHRLGIEAASGVDDVDVQVFLVDDGA